MCGHNPTSKKTPASVAALGMTLACIAAAPVYAQDDAIPAVLEEILVTAQKREQTLADVPASVSTISGETVNDYLGSAENIRALAGRVPSLNVESSNGRVAPRFYIRGLGNIDFDVNANQPVAMVFDEIGLENNVLRSLPLFDLARVEVLKGPQGSLFGRNTNAGIVKIDSARPTYTREGYFRMGYGVRDTLFAEYAQGGEIDTGVAARLSLKYQERDDWIDNTVNGPGDDFGAFDELAYRLQFLFEPSEDFTGRVKIHGFHQGGTQPQVFYANALELGQEGLRSGFDEEVASHNSTVAQMELDHFGISGGFDWDLGTTTFTSITAFDTVENFQATDVDGGNTVFPPETGTDLGTSLFIDAATGDGLNDHHQFTQEFRLSSASDDRFWQVGLYYFDEDFTVINEDFVGFPTGPFFDEVAQQTTSYAVFGQYEFDVSEQFTVTVGGRFTSDEKDLEVIPGPTSGSPADTISVDDDYFSWDLAFTFDQNDDWSWYGRAAQGSRGPVTLGRFGFTSSADTETSTSIEFGFKSTLAGGRARWNAAVYTFRNDDQQLTATGGTANTNQLLNADRVNGFGIETDFEMLVTDDLLIIANLSYNDTEIDDPDLRDDLCGAPPLCTGLDPVVGTRNTPFGLATEVSIDGNPLPRSPEWLANLIAQYSVPLDSGASVYFNTDWNYRSESNLFLHESVEFVAEERILGSVRIGYRNADGNMDFAVVGRNITDEITVDGGLNFLNLTAFINEPAFWGVEFRYDF